jgi:hypothetical protein
MPNNLAVIFKVKKDDLFRAKVQEVKEALTDPKHNAYLSC